LSAGPGTAMMVHGQDRGSVRIPGRMQTTGRITMRQFARLMLTGLVALSLTLTSLPAQATDWTVSIQDAMNLVYCLVGLGGCEGLEPGADMVDITSDNQAVFETGIAVFYQAAFNAGAASVDVTSNDAAVIAAAVDAVDITSDNQASYDDGYAQACEDSGSTLDSTGQCGGSAVAIPNAPTGECDVNVIVATDGTVTYNTAVALGGVEIHHDGSLVGASGGDLEAPGWTVIAGPSAILFADFTGFALIEPGSGILTVLSGGDSPGDHVTGSVFSGGPGEEEPVVCEVDGVCGDAN